MQEKMKLVLVLMVAGFLSALLGLGLFLGKSKINEEKTALAAVQKKLADEDAKLAKVPALQKKVSELADTVERYEQILPDSRELVNIVNFFNAAKDAANIPAVNSQPVEKKLSRTRVKVQPTYVKHQFEVTFESTFEQMATFVNHLETSPRFFQVDKFAIDGDNKNGLLTSKITLATYRFNPESAAPKSSRSSRTKTGR